MASKTLAWLIPTVAMTVFGWNASAQAQTITNFDIEYDTKVEIFPLESQPGFVRAIITGTSTNPIAPFGLNQFESNTYGRGEPIGENIIRFTFNSEPTQVGLPSTFPAFSDRYFGGPNELSGKANDSAVVNFNNGTIAGGGTITIFDGTGVFEDATGQITFTQQDTFDPTSTAPAVGRATLKFQIQTPRQVPEYTPATTLLAAGLTGAAYLRFKKGKTLKAKGMDNSLSPKPFTP